MVYLLAYRPRQSICFSFYFFPSEDNISAVLLEYGFTFFLFFLDGVAFLEAKSITSIQPRIPAIQIPNAPQKNQIGGIPSHKCNPKKIHAGMEPSKFKTILIKRQMKKPLFTLVLRNFIHLPDIFSDGSFIQFISFSDT